MPSIKLVTACSQLSTTELGPSNLSAACEQICNNLCVLTCVDKAHAQSSSVNPYMARDAVLQSTIKRGTAVYFRFGKQSHGREQVSHARGFGTLKPVTNEQVFYVILCQDSSYTCLRAVQQIFYDKFLVF